MELYYEEKVFNGIFFAGIGKFRVIRINIKKEKPFFIKDYSFQKDAVDRADNHNKNRNREDDIFLVFDDNGQCQYDNEKLCNVPAKFSHVPGKFFSINK